ncbi:MAG: SDR family NAD(P)-dependent oxidoreductase [Dehalococcoidia bacterium]|uniref:SDR family NAD(P)-dependent oxidoreductase n=1 Tax=Candidatus Amarobacter glycogenicus TaxID=3140699 RepID=UPI003135F650|nr:SDR family NAD(P)-dependent oxidoreductase [Dehalococcoidia bacterium]
MKARSPGHRRSASLGRAYAMDLAARGAKVVVNDLGGDPHGVGENRAAAKSGLRDQGRRREATRTYDSVADYDGGFNMVKTAIDAYRPSRLSHLQCGHPPRHRLPQQDADDWDKVFAVRIKGSFTVLRRRPVFRQQSYGRVVLTTSSSGIYGQFGQANYGAAKTSMLGLMNVLKQEGAKYNVNVNTVAPVAGTRLTQTVMPQEMIDRLKPELVAPRSSTWSRKSARTAASSSKPVRATSTGQPSSRAPASSRAWLMPCRPSGARKTGARSRASKAPSRWRTLARPSRTIWRRRQGLIGPALVSHGRGGALPPLLFLGRAVGFAGMERERLPRHDHFLGIAVPSVNARTAKGSALARA